MVVATAGHITGLPATNHLRKILMAREQNLYVFMQTTTSVVTRIDDNAFLQVVFAQDIRIHVTETGIIHTFYMHIAQTSVRQTFHLGSPTFYPTLV